MFELEKIYIAGPECFYKKGPAILDAMRRRAESLGFGVTLPNSHPLDMENPDLRKRADSIFEDLRRIMKETTVIIADLEAYRGSEADSGTVYELGMAYADGLKCYGYTRDKRSLAWKDQKYTMRGGVIYDERNQPAPYSDLPFSPSVIGSTKIVEGDFDDCLAMLMTDLEEEWKTKGRGNGERGRDGAWEGRAIFAPAGKPAAGPAYKPRVYLSDTLRYGKDGRKGYEQMKQLCASLGLEALTPCDRAEGLEQTKSANPYTKAAALTENYRCLVQSCDAVIADLNHYRGYECANDVGFECGMGFEMGKRLFGYMDDTRPCIETIPNLGEAEQFRDMTGSNVENFNYPVNLMFGSSMEIYQGRFEEVIGRVAEELHSPSPGNHALEIRKDFIFIQ